MDDKFLYQNRPAVRPDFQQKLYERLSSRAVQSKAAKPNFKLVTRFALIGLILFAALFTFSEPARAGIVELIRIIAGFEVEEMDSLPGYGEGTGDTPKHTSLTYLLQEISFEFALPAYTPEGYTLIDRVYYDDNIVFLDYFNEDRDFIHYSVQNTMEPAVLTGFDSAEEIQINGQPALLIRGAFVDGVWNYTLDGMTIYFKQDGLTYILGQFPSRSSTGEPGKGTDLSLDELTRMVGSIPALKNDEDGVYFNEPQPVEEILANPPFTFEMPGYIPEGFVPDEGIAAYSNAWVSILWMNENGDDLNLMVQENWKITIPAGVGAAERQWIDGHSTLIIRGAYVDEQWDASADTIELYWRKGEFIYQLSSSRLSEEELIKVAESFE
jgi:hypothetical protein